MRILYINHYAGSLMHGMEFRPFYMAREWVRAGHEVDIIAASYSHVRGRQPQTKGEFTDEQIEGVNYIWCLTPPYAGNGVKRMVNIFTFLWRVLRLRRRWARRKPQAVIASSTYPLDIFPAWWLARRSRARLIFEVHDLWPLSPVELGGMSKWHPFIMLLQVAEDFAYRHADAVVSMLPLAKDYMISRGMKPEKFHHVPNGIDLEEWANPEAEAGRIPAAVIEQLKADRAAGRFCVTYLGTHGVANALESFLAAAAELKVENFSFYLIGPGPEKERLKAKAQVMGLKQVHFFDSLPKTAVPALLRRFDALYIGLQKQSLFRFGISPNKIMDYMASGVPVINAIEAGNDPVRESGCGLSVGSENPKALAQGLRDLAGQSVADREIMGARGVEYIRARHTYGRLAEEFLKALSEPQDAKR